jgi:hypothetical protein
MTAVEVVILVVAVIVGVGLLVRLGPGFFGSGTADSPIRGRVRNKAERDGIDRDLANYSARGGHHADPPGIASHPTRAVCSSV